MKYFSTISYIVIAFLAACEENKFNEVVGEDPTITIITPSENETFCGEGDTVKLNSFIADNKAIDLIQWTITDRESEEVFLDDSILNVGDLYILSIKWIADFENNRQLEITINVVDNEKNASSATRNVLILNPNLCRK